MTSTKDTTADQALLCPTNLVPSDSCQRFCLISAEPNDNSTCVSEKSWGTVPRWKEVIIKVAWSDPDQKTYKLPLLSCAGAFEARELEGLNQSQINPLFLSFNKLREKLRSELKRRNVPQYLATSHWRFKAIYGDAGLSIEVFDDTSMVLAYNCWMESHLSVRSNATRMRDWWWEIQSKQGEDNVSSEDEQMPFALRSIRRRDHLHAEESPSNDRATRRQDRSCGVEPQEPLEIQSGKVRENGIRKTHGRRSKLSRQEQAMCYSIDNRKWNHIFG